MDIGDNIIDSRDVISEVSDLRTMLCDTPFGDTSYDSDELKQILEDTPKAWEDHFDRDDVEKLINLLDFEEQASAATSEWTYGATFILDEYFEDYAQQLANDIGAIDRNASWPLGCIDWEQAADELKSDYTCIEVGGYSYWVRA